jgi:tRNA threonylcarbamoyladenosine biosynthesis protein TsaB
MLILGIDTATAQVSVAIGGHEGVLAAFQSARGRQHAETVTPAIEFVCAQARVELHEIGCVAVDVGPGLFTGMRVGIATAKAIATALRVPMIGAASLDLVAMPVRHSRRRIVAVIDAKRGEVFTAHYVSAPGGVQRLGDYRCETPAELVNELLAAPEDYLLVGDGAMRHSELFAEVGGVEIAEHSLAQPNATALVQLAHSQALREQWVNSWELQPLYLRQPDAEINWQERA